MIYWSSDLSSTIERARVTRATRLDLSNKGLTNLPESIGQLTQLEFLDLSNNLLTELPESVGQLANLLELYLEGNRLKVLPESLRDIKKLKLLFLHENDELELPPEVLGPTWHDTLARYTIYYSGAAAKPVEILEYYFQLCGGRRPLNEAKLILVGRGGVGKTSLVNRLVLNHFDKDEKKTEGIRINEWKIRPNGDEDVRLNIWDFGGQEIMHATHQFFLTRRSLYLLVVSGREGVEDADAEYWLKLIEGFGGESPVIVVLNKIREHSFDLNRLGLQQKYSDLISGFIKTDCADGTGIDELRQAINQETGKLKHLRDAFPATWFAIKEQLAGMKNNYLSFNEYRDVCIQHGEKNETAQERLAVYLHNLGVVLNYKDDPRLQDMHVLNPNWVTNGIYTILNSARLERQKGIIDLNELPEILSESEYPRTMHRFLFDLMKRFNLCFSFPDNDARYLIPELLDKQQPKEVTEFKSEMCLNFQYQYSVLPEGLLPRFIVRTHVRSEHPSRWRTGVILKFEGCRALVKADVLERKVCISVYGSIYHRRRLLAVIRSYFEEIHHYIPRLQPLEMVPVPSQPNLLVPYEKLLTLENKGIENFQDVVGSEVVELNVQELLNGVDLEGERGKNGVLKKKGNALRLFFSYSHKDESLLNELETHLTLLRRLGVIEPWHDRKIEAGDKWKEEIDENLESADIILLLVSSNFINSDYCYEKEMRYALERHAKKDARVIPIIVREVNWESAPFANPQVLPKDGLAVMSWPDRDAAWRNVSEKIELVAQEMRKESKQQ